MVLPLILASVLSLGGGQSEPDVVRTWIANVLAHQPGSIDKPLRDVAAEPPANLDAARRVRRDAPIPTRSDIFRRGARGRPGPLRRRRDERGGAGVTPIGEWRPACDDNGNPI